jgi:uncharacterized membrane protein YeaQ/YmgE (transglycosylase-associated protein family)
MERSFSPRSSPTWHVADKPLSCWRQSTGDLVLLLTILFFGLFTGWVANLLLGGGTRPADWAQVLIAGFVGSFVGGLLASLIAGDGLRIRPSGIIGSIVGAVVVLVIWRGVSSSRRSSSSDASGKGPRGGKSGKHH